jgi:hypothetical protein
MSIDAQRLGDRLFGRGLRLRIALWIASSGSKYFNQTEVATAVGETGPEVSTDLGRIVELGMLKKHPRARGNAPQYFQRLSSPFWEIIESAGKSLASVSAAAVRRRRSESED